MQTLLDTIVEELEQSPSSVTCAGKETTSSCFSLDRVKCHKTEDYFGDECRLKIFVDGKHKRTLKKDMSDGQLWTVRLDFLFDQKVVVELWDYDSPPIDPHDRIGRFTLSKESMDESKDFTATKTLKSGRAHYNIKYNVKRAQAAPLPDIPGWSVIENAPSTSLATGSLVLKQMAEPSSLCNEPSDPYPLVSDDDRRPVTDTRRAPFRWICKLVSVFPPNSSGVRQVGDGTGFLIDPDTIVTAGHNLHHPDLGIADIVLVIPGLNKKKPFDSSKLTSATAPYGAYVIERRTAGSSNFFVSPEWHASATDEHDYGLIRFRKGGKILSGLNVSDGWNTVTKGLADVGVANIERQKNGVSATAEDFIRLLRLHTDRLAVTGYSGDRPCRQLGMRRGKVRKILLPDRSSHNLMESFLDTTAGNSGSPYWIIKNRTVRGRRRRQHILVGIHRGGIFPFSDRDPSTELRVASVMVVITPAVWRRLTNRSFLQAL